MGIRRRKLLQFGGAGSLLAVLPLHVAAGPLASHLRRFVIQDSKALPWLVPGTTVGVDVSVTTFAGDGIYLYPAWGRPRPYRVQEVAPGKLIFSDPASGRECWCQTLRGEAFAGLLLPDGAFSPGQLAASPVLQVPAKLTV